MELIVMLCLLAITGVVSFILYFLFCIDSDLTLHLLEKIHPNLSSCNGKVIWITGASSGIGESLAYEYAKHKAKLILSGTNEQRLENVRLKCIEIGLLDSDVKNLLFEMSDFSVHDEMVAKAITFFGKVDILINNAGKSQRAEFQDIHIDVDVNLFKINVFGPINITRKLVKHWLQNDLPGKIGVVSSGAGIIGVPYSSSYTGSKHALHGYFNGFRNEAGSSKISISIVCPGPIATPFLGRAVTDKPGETFGQTHVETKSRMTSERCSRLIAITVANCLPDAWISPNPALLLYYVSIYFPTISKFGGILLKKTSFFSNIRDSGGSLQEAKEE